MRVGVATAAARRAAFLVVAWWAVVEGDPDAVAAGAVAVTLGVAASLVLLPVRERGLRWMPLVAGLPRFFLLSISGSFDVARRVFRLQVPVSPAFVEVPLTLERGGSHVLLGCLVSLTPGTLNAGLTGPRMCLHVLDDPPARVGQVRQLEAWAARLLEDRPGGLR